MGLFAEYQRILWDYFMNQLHKYDNVFQMTFELLSVMLKLQFFCLSGLLSK